MLKVLGSIFLVLVALSIAAVAWWWQRPTPAGMNPIDAWCATQLRGIADDLFEPAFEFTSLRLELPASVTLEDVAIIADGVTIIGMSSLRLELREMPKIGQPLVIESATFVDPEVRLVERSDGTLVGFANFMKSTEGERRADGGSSVPSDFLAIRGIDIANGRFEWAPADAEHPMVFEKLNVNLSTNPDSTRPGWYEFVARIDRAPIIQLSWDGGLSIDTGELALDDTTLRVDLSEDNYGALTPSAQAFLREYSIVGDLDLHAVGRIPLSDPSRADLSFDVSLRNSSAAVGDYQFPVESAEMTASFQAMQLACDPLTINAFGGRIDAKGTLTFADDQAYTLDVAATDVLIESMLRPAEGQPPEYSGQVDVNLAASGTTAESGRDLSGTGTITIDHAKLINIPVIGAIANAINFVHRDARARDRGEIRYGLSSDRITIEEGLLQSPTAAVRGSGDIYFDGRLALRVNAGPLEKAQQFLGPIGDLFGELTDALLPYRVSGTWDDPKVKAAPLGFGLHGSRDEPE